MSAQPFVQSAGPLSTTAQLASQVPVTGSKSADPADAADSPRAPPGQFTPGVSDVPGGFPASIPPTPAAASEQQQFSVNPLPASNTPTNPINLKAGEPVPKSDFSAKEVGANVKLDKDAYEQADASNLGIDAGKPFLPEVVTPYETRAKEGRGVLDLPPISAGMIPESSLPIVGNASTAAEKRTKVPAIVKDSQAEAGALAEASEVPASVEQKAAVESELKSEVSPVPSAAEGNTIKDSATGVAQTATSYASSAAAYASSTIASVAAAAGITSATGADGLPAAAAVPEIVKDSQVQAHAPAEASADPLAVEKKAEFESELKTEIPAAPATAGDATITDQAKAAVEGAGATVAATAVAAQEYAKATSPPKPSEESAINAAKTSTQFTPVVVNGVSSSTTEAVSLPSATKAPVGPANSVPEPVKDSQAAAGVAPEASGVPSAVAAKESVEAQLTKEVKPADPKENDKPTPKEAAETLKLVESDKGEPATAAPVAAETTPPAGTRSPSKKSTEAPSSTSTPDRSKSKRKSFFGRVKEKLHLGRSEKEEGS